MSGASMFKCLQARGSKLSISTKSRCDRRVETWDKMIRSLVIQNCVSHNEKQQQLSLF